MPLREDILTPIPGDNPGGQDLRYAPIYDKIKEARREDDELAQGAWQHERKLADPILVIKLSQEAIAKQSKDLQIAAWLTEALLKKERLCGIPGGPGPLPKPDRYFLGTSISRAGRWRRRVPRRPARLDRL